MTMQSFQNWVSLPETQSARAAVARVAEGVCQRRVRPSVNPLFLHGPSGTGKTHLTEALVRYAAARRPDLLVANLEVGSFEDFRTESDSTKTEDLAAARNADLVVIEDLQHLSGIVVEPLVSLIDRCRSRQRQVVVTAACGPAELRHLPDRLTSRLASGLVIGLLPLSPDSRRRFLGDKIRRRNLKVPDAVVDWLTRNLPGSARQLEGALVRLETLQALHAPFSVAVVEEHFRTEAENHRPTVERIAQRVCDYFQVETRQLQSRDRSRDSLLPRQVGMYLARQLTALSLEQIGAFFGGRDHSTVLHACRKVEETLAHDERLSGAVRQLHADLR
jgi:chromosomal replication initiator protein